MAWMGMWRSVCLGYNIEFPNKAKNLSFSAQWLLNRGMYTLIGYNMTILYIKAELVTMIRCCRSYLVFCPESGHQSFS